MKISGRNGSKKKLGGTNMLNYSSELRKLSEGSGSRSIKEVVYTNGSHSVVELTKEQKELLETISFEL